MDVLKRSLKRMGTLTHLALLTCAVLEDPDNPSCFRIDRGWTLQVISL